MAVGAAKAKVREKKAAREKAATRAAYKGSTFTAPPAGMKLNRNGIVPPNSLYNSNSSPLNLITPAQLKALPRGTVLHTMGGSTHKVGVDKPLDGDTRGGFLAAGFLVRK